MLLTTEFGVFTLVAPSGPDADRVIWVCAPDAASLDRLRATLLPDLGPNPPAADGRGRWCAPAPRAAVEALAAAGGRNGAARDVPWVAKADLYGALVTLPGPVFLLRDPQQGHAASVFPLARCAENETPDAAARRVAERLAGQPLRILSALPERFAGPGGMAAFFVMAPQDSEPAAPAPDARWWTAAEAQALIARLADPRARQRDAAVLAAAMAALG
jgi:hypothetical protein